jgi:hypothetical protein
MGDGDRTNRLTVGRSACHSLARDQVCIDRRVGLSLQLRLAILAQEVGFEVFEYLIVARQT